MLLVVAEEDELPLLDDRPRLLPLLDDEELRGFTFANQSISRNPCASISMQHEPRRTSMKHERLTRWRRWPVPSRVNAPQQIHGIDRPERCSCHHTVVARHTSDACPPTRDPEAHCDAKRCQASVERVIVQSRLDGIDRERDDRRSERRHDGRRHGVLSATVRLASAILSRCTTSNGRMPSSRRASSVGIMARPRAVREQPSSTSERRDAEGIENKSEAVREQERGSEAQEQHRRGASSSSSGGGARGKQKAKNEAPRPGIEPGVQA